MDGNGMGMSAKSAFSWEYIYRKMFPEEAAKLRKQLMEEYRSGKFSNKELMERYCMSERTYYNTIKRYKNATCLEDFMDKPRAPKNPHRKLSPEDIEFLIEIAREDVLGLKKRKLSS
jgi:transposase